MRSLDKLNKNHPKKKTTGPAVKNGSNKSDVSLAGKKKEAPAVKEKTFETKVISFEKDDLSEEKDVIVAEEIQTRNETISSAVLGKRYKCYKCGTKFYDLGKPLPLCPLCGVNQLDEVIKVSRKRRGRHRAAFAAKTEPHTIAPDENEELHEVTDELNSEFGLDVDDIVLEEREYAEDKEDKEDKEELMEDVFMAKTAVTKKEVKKPLKAVAKAAKPKAAAEKAAKPKAVAKVAKPKAAVKSAKPKAVAAKASKPKAVAKTAKPKAAVAKAAKPKAVAKVAKPKAAVKAAKPKAAAAKAAKPKAVAKVAKPKAAVKSAKPKAEAKAAKPKAAAAKAAKPKAVAKVAKPKKA